MDNKMTPRPGAVFALLTNLASAQVGELDNDQWAVWQRLRVRWWIKGCGGALRVPLGIWRAFHSRPGCAELMRCSESRHVCELAARLDADAAAAAIDDLMSQHGIAKTTTQ